MKTYFRNVTFRELSKLTIVLILGLVITQLIMIVLSSNTYAADVMSVNSRLKHGNANEYCTGSAKGMVWLSNNSSNYYSESVTIGMDTNAATVQVRGAVNTCGTTLSSSTVNNAYAGGVKSQTDALKISGNEFFRGSVPGNTTYAWSSKGNWLSATLDVDDVALCRGFEEKITGTVKVSIYRFLLWKQVYPNGNTMETVGGDGVEHIDVKVVRSCPELSKPKVQVLGSDLIVRNSSDKQVSTVSTAITRINNKTFGSWAEYGIVASGSVHGMASGAAYVGGANTSSICSLSLLTLSNYHGNSCETSKVGNYSVNSSSPLNNIARQFRVTQSTPPLSGNVSIDTLKPGTVYAAKASLSLSASASIPKGKWVVILAPSYDVRIDSNILYSNAQLADSKDIPQLVIIARNIIVDDSVTHIDAWLLASGTGSDGKLITCDASGVDEPSELTTKVCNKQLLVNGPVIAHHLNMYRTLNSNIAASAGVPAEVFNLRADAYAWASTIDFGNKKVLTVSTKEVPVRY